MEVINNVLAIVEINILHINRRGSLKLWASIEKR
jgi:hypothetical protein